MYMQGLRVFTTRILILVTTGLDPVVHAEATTAKPNGELLEAPASLVVP
jgi:hypothetical protein